jgi:surface antigen
MPALGQVNLGFFNNSALGELTEQDAVLLRDALQSALKSEAAGGVFDWANPASGAKGTVRVRQAYQSQGAPCRVLEIATTAHYKTFRDTYDVCRDQNGAWAPTGG